MTGLSKPLSLPSRLAPGLQAQATATLLDWGLELRVWVATCVSGLSFYAASALGLAFQESTLSAIAVIFFATLALYNLDGSLDAPRRTSFASSNDRIKRRRLHLTLTALSAAVLVLLVARLSTRALLLTGGGIAVSSLYAIPLSLKRKATSENSRALRLKSLPFFKAPFVGFAVGTAVVWVPLWAQEGSIPSVNAFVLTCALSLYCTANALLFDIPDVGEDEQTGVPTLPVRWGLSGARWASRGLAVAGLICSLLFTARVQAPANAVGLLSLGAALLVFTQLLDFQSPRRTVAVWVDGALLLPLGVQFFLSL